MQRSGAKRAWVIQGKELCVTSMKVREGSATDEVQKEADVKTEHLYAR